MPPTAEDPVQEAADYQAWLSSQPTFAEIQARPPGDPVAGSASYAVCAACHGSQAEGLVALNAPKLTGQHSQYLKRQLRNYKLGRRGSHEDDIYGLQMAPMAATLVNDTMIDNVTAYIQSLPDTPAPTTVTGGVDKGAKLYTGCAYCHGADARGIEMMNAPRLAGMTDWYMLNQLRNFKQGIRGHHPEDLEGKQMGFMSKMLIDEQAMMDVIAYINTL